MIIGYRLKDSKIRIWKELYVDRKWGKMQVKCMELLKVAIAGLLK